MTQHLLVVDDDLRLRNLLKKFLIQEGFWISLAQNITQAKQALSFFVFDLVILDRMMPGGAGSLLLETTEKNFLPPILFLSAMGEPEDRISGLEMGAEDYLVKPFEPRELILRIRRILQRNPKKNLILLGEKTYNVDESKLYDETNQPIQLTPIEQKLLEFLAKHANKTVLRHEIMNEIFESSSNDRVVDVQINRLRRKIESHPQDPQILFSIRGQGYMLKEHCGKINF
jgi:two-component system, OmpR family, phosphate regulon response regulator OmpR